MIGWELSTLSGLGVSVSTSSSIYFSGQIGISGSVPSAGCVAMGAGTSVLGLALIASAGSSGLSSGLHGSSCWLMKLRDGGGNSVFMSSSLVCISMLLGMVFVGYGVLKLSLAVDSWVSVSSSQLLCCAGGNQSWCLRLGSVSVVHVSLNGVSVCCPGSGLGCLFAMLVS